MYILICYTAFDGFFVNSLNRCWIWGKTTIFCGGVEMERYDGMQVFLKDGMIVTFYYKEVRQEIGIDDDFFANWGDDEPLLWCKINNGKTTYDSEVMEASIYAQVGKILEFCFSRDSGSVELWRSNTPIERIEYK